MNEEVSHEGRHPGASPLRSVDAVIGSRCLDGEPVDLRAPRRELREWPFAGRSPEGLEHRAPRWLTPKISGPTTGGSAASIR